MTEPQHKLYDFIKHFIAKHGYGPSYDEMKDAIGHKSKGSVAQLIDRLEERGLVRRVA